MESDSPGHSSHFPVEPLSPAGRSPRAAEAFGWRQAQTVRCMTHWLRLCRRSLGSTWGAAASGSLLLYLALPPWNLWPLAWFAPLPWLRLIRRPDWDLSHPYRALWLVGFLFWLFAIHWIRLPHWANHFGLLALAAYLACYLPAFIGLSRIAVHTVGIPLLLAAPIVWTGLELARAHLLTGFLMATLAHTQYRWTDLIQISDLAGAYGVSFVMMFVAACLHQLLAGDKRWTSLWPLIPAGGVLAATLAYGSWRDAATREASAPRPTVALIQGNIVADWKQDPDKAARIMREYAGLSREAAATARGELDLVVWPETMFRATLYEFAEDVPADHPARRYHEDLVTDLGEFARNLASSLLLGIEGAYLTGDVSKQYNSAVAVDRNGNLLGRYDKQHLVMFGEYVPLARLFPILHRLTPIGLGIDAGNQPRAFHMDGICYAPNICYETVIPHVIHEQVRTLADRGSPPDVLINLTNDAWFRGSSELEMHLACDVFRAVECRLPLLIAANGGITAWIDASGRVQEQLAPLQPGFLLADVQLGDGASLYLRLGDWPAGLCLMLLPGLALWACWVRR